MKVEVEAELDEEFAESEEIRKLKEEIKASKLTRQKSHDRHDMEMKHVVVSDRKRKDKSSSKVAPLPTASEELRPYEEV